MLNAESKLVKLNDDTTTDHDIPANATGEVEAGRSAAAVEEEEEVIVVAVAEEGDRRQLLQ